MTEFQLWLTDTFNARLSNCCIQKYVLLIKYAVVQIIQYGFCVRGKERNSDPSFHGNWSHIGIICTTIMLYCIGMVLQIFYSKQKGLNSWKSRRQLHRYIYIYFNVAQSQNSLSGVNYMYVLLGTVNIFFCWCRKRKIFKEFFFCQVEHQGV